MLGISVSDELGAEKKGLEEGLSLLPVSTVFKSEKTLKQVEGVVKGADGLFDCLNGCQIEGYEIHMGSSMACSDNKNLVVTKGNVLGSYVHGIFDSKDFAKRLVDIVCEHRKLPKRDFKLESKNDIQEKELDKLADTLRESLDWKLIYNAIGL